MLIAIRHGETELNGVGNGGNGAERTRGWLPVTLTLQGMQDMIETAENLSDVEGVTALHSSDLVRGVQSAEEVAHALNMTLNVREDLRDWNIGEFAGQEVKKILKDLHAFMDEPLKQVPGGESYQSFLNRAVPFITQLVEDEDLQIIVTHNRLLTLIDALTRNKGKYPSTSVLKDKGPVKPSGLIIVDSSWKIVFTYKPQAGD